MSAKLIYSLTDNESPDLQKQIGCMNGFFQLFDRQRRIAGHGRLGNNAHPSKRILPSGKEIGNEAVNNINGLENAKEKGSKKVVKEKRRSSTESSRHSFSSSCSSSFSSLDYNKTVNNNPEPSPSSQNSSSGTPLRDAPVDQPNTSSTQFSRKSLDLRDVVKDSMHREARGLSLVKTAAKEEPVVHILKHIDSPRPMELPKSAKPRNSLANDSFRVFPKFREGPFGSNEDKDSRTLWAPKDRRRLSYDGRESQDNLKSTIKIKELPRLSLDSRQGSTRGSTSVSEAKSYLLHDLRIEKRSSNETINMLQEPGSSRRASSVVAKLMGLVDPMPVSDAPQRQDCTLETEKTDLMLRSSRATKKDQFPGSPRISHKDLNSPRMRNANSVHKMNANQKFPIETAPWRQQNGQKGPTKISVTPLTVYGEIEKRLADLEFKKSGKDLRALKQILEAMQKTKVVSAEQEDTKLVSQASSENSLDVSSFLGSQRNLQISSSIPIGHKSPIVIMKPAKLIGRNTDSASAISPIEKVSVEKRTTKHVTVRNVQVPNSFNRHQFSEDKSANMRIAKSVQASKMVDSEERFSGTVSPRLQQRRLGLDKQSSPASPSDSNSRRRNNIRQPNESNSPGKKCRPRSSNTLRSSDQGNTSSAQSESNISLASEDIDIEVTSIIRADQNTISEFGRNAKMTEPGRATSEQPSPISVLDDTFYRDESPSPVKKTSNAFKDDELPYPDEVEWTLMNLDNQSNGGHSDLRLNGNIKHWFQNPQVTNLTNLELLCDSTNPDHIYISHILSASDLPSELESRHANIAFHHAGHLINPKLFFALEKHNSRARPPLYDQQFEKVHRKLVFDVVNEILVQKSAATKSWLTKKEPRRKQLLREVCSEVDQLQSKNSGNSEEDDEDSLRSIICDDMIHWPMNWTEYGKEIPSVVLDLERLIFKDLITELVTCEAGCLKTRLGGHCRQLLYK